MSENSLRYALIRIYLSFLQIIQKDLDSLPNKLQTYMS
jgi:hypothetical protein